MIYIFSNILIVFILPKSLRSQNENRITQGVQSEISETSNWPIFKTYPIFHTDSLQYCNFYQNNNVYYFKVGNQEYFALSLLTCGFNVFNLQNPSNPTLEVNYRIQFGKINKFKFDSFRSVLWIAHNDGYIYKIQADKKPFIVELAFQTHNLVKSYFVDFIPNINNLILILCQNEIQVFSSNVQSNNQDSSSFKYFKSLTLDNNSLTQNSSNEIFRILFINNLLFIGSQLQGLQIYKVEQSQTLDISISFIYKIQPNNMISKDFQISQKNIIYLVQNLGGIFSYNANDCITKGDETSCKSIILIENKSRPERGGSMYITKDQKYLIQLFYTYGIQIYDISSTLLKGFQTISYEGDTVSLALNEQETFIVLSGSTKLQIFLRDQNKITLDQPNILLQIIQSTDQTFYRDTSIFAPEFDCYLDYKRNLLYLSRYAFGLTVLKKYPQGILKVSSQLEQGVDGQAFTEFRFFQDSTLAYATKTRNGMAVIDFTDPENPVFIKNNLRFGQSGNFNSIDCNQKLYLCAIALSIGGTLIIDISNLQDPQFLSNISISETGFQASYKVGLMKNQKVVFIAIDSIGIYTFDLNSPTNPVLLSSKNLGDGSSLVIYSKQLNEFNQQLFFIKQLHHFKNRVSQDDSFMIAASSYIGISIIDIGDLKNLKVISEVRLQGRLWNVVLMSKQKYVIVLVSELPTMHLIDIQDKQNPILLQTVKRKTTLGFFSMCMDPYENEGFVTTGRFLIQTNFHNQVIFQRIIFQLIPIPGSKEKNILEIDPTSPLYVGQIVNLRIIPLNMDGTVSIKNVMVYENFILQPLKSWMMFQSEQNLLQLTIPRDALQQDKQGNYVQTSQQIIFQSHIALSASSFINSYLNINQTLSSKILAECQRQGYLDEFYIVRENFDFKAQVQFSFENIFDANSLTSLTDDKKKDIINAMKYVFKQNIVYYPIEIKVAPSIQFDLNNSQENYIQSTKDSVLIYIRVSKDSGKFVNKNYPGILSIISQQQDEIKIEGSPQKLNQVLSQKIKFFSFLPQEIIIFSMRVQDNLNYDIEKSVSYKEAFFIGEQSKVGLHDTLTLQDDFSRKFDEESIYIKERFSYQIPTEIFDCEDGQQLEFSIRIKGSDGEYQEIPQNSWLQFSEKERVLSGQPTEKEFYELVTLRLTVTDGYSNIIQYLEIKIGKIPFTYFVQIFIQIIGPLLGIIGFWKYKFIIINLLRKQQYTYQKEFVKIGDSYEKQILLNNWNLKVANKILEYFTRVFSDKEIMQQILLYQQYVICSQGKLNTQGQNNDSVQNSVQNSHINLLNLQNSNQVNKNVDEIIENDSKVQSNQLIKNNSNPMISSSQQENAFKRTSTVESLLYQRNKKTKFKRLIKQLEQQIKRVTQSQADSPKVFQSVQRMDIRQRQRQKSFDTKEFWLFDQNGFINYSEIIQLLLFHNSNEKIKNQIFTEEIIQNFKEKCSLIRQTFESFLAEYILQKDQFSHNIFKELYYKYQQPENPQWYKKYCIVKANIEDIHSNPVPKTIFADSVLQYEIKSLFFDQNTHPTIGNELQNLPFSLNLIKETIKAYSLGFISKYAKIKSKSSGESLHIKDYNIKQIISYNQKIDNLYFAIKKKIKCPCRNKSLFIEKPLVDNYKLPPWIKSVEIICNNLLIIGYPEYKDIGRFYLYIYNKQNFVVRAFEIEVIDDKEQTHISKSLITKQNNSEVTWRYLVKKSKSEFNNFTNNENINMQNIFTNSENENIFEEIKKPHFNQFTL